MLFLFFYKCYNATNLFYICFIMYIHMIFDEFSMFDFRGFFFYLAWSYVILICLMTVYLIPFHLVCVVYKFSQDKFQPCIIKMVLQRISTCTSMPFRKKILFFKRKLICNGTNGSWKIWFIVWSLLTSML